MANLVAHGPHGFVAFDCQPALQRQHGDAAFLASHEPDHPESFRQRGSSLVADGARSQRGLITAGPTMIEVAGALEISLIMLAAGTPKSLWPMQTKQMLLTGFLSAKLFLKLHQAECFLLHRLAPFSKLFKLIIPYYSEQRQ